jgi:hypothetical protein
VVNPANFRRIEIIALYFLFLVRSDGVNSSLLRKCKILAPEIGVFVA